MQSVSPPSRGRASRVRATSALHHVRHEADRLAHQALHRDPRPRRREEDQSRHGISVEECWVDRFCESCFPLFTHPHPNGIWFRQYRGNHSRFDRAKLELTRQIAFRPSL